MTAPRTAAITACRRVLPILYHLQRGTAEDRNPGLLLSSIDCSTRWPARRGSLVPLGRTCMEAASGSAGAHTFGAGGGLHGVGDVWQQLATDAVLVVMMLKFVGTFACSVCLVIGTNGMVR